MDITGMNRRMQQYLMIKEQSSIQQNYHEWTQEIVDAQIIQYEKILEEIKAGVLYAKPNEDGIGYAQIPPNADDIITVYSTDFVRNDAAALVPPLYRMNGEKLQPFR